MATMASITAAIVNIMASRAGGRAIARTRQPSWGGAPVVVGLLAGILLLVLGTPRMIAGFLVTAASDVQWELEAGNAVEPGRIAAAAAALAAASGWEPSAEREGLRGFLLVRQAQAVPPGQEREQLYAAAMAATERGLSLGPVQPHAWASLAVLRERAGDPRGAVAAMRMSMLSGAFEPRLILWRLAAAMRLRAAMDQEALALLRRQIRLAWIFAPDGLMKLGADLDGNALIRQALEELSEEEIARYLERSRRN